MLTGMTLYLGWPVRGVKCGRFLTQATTYLLGSLLSIVREPFVFLSDASRVAFRLSHRVVWEVSVTRMRGPRFIPTSYPL